MERRSRWSELVFLADETGAAVARELARPITTAALPEAEVKLTTRTNRFGPWKDRYVRSEHLIRTDKPGRLRELMIISPTDDFSILVSLDGMRWLDKSFAELEEISQESDYVSAFEQLDEEGKPTGNYVLGLRDISWLKSFDLMLVSGGVTFSHVYATWDETVG